MYEMDCDMFFENQNGRQGLHCKKNNIHFLKILERNGNNMKKIKRSL
jgi:hypothetical protein